MAKFLQDICHREDPTRPVTCGMDQVSCVLANGFAAMIDIPGLNYRTQRYKESYDQLPQNLILGSETASTVSSRGVYKFPVEERKVPNMKTTNVLRMTWKHVRGRISQMKISP